MYGLGAVSKNGWLGLYKRIPGEVGFASAEFEVVDVSLFKSPYLDIYLKSGSKLSAVTDREIWRGCFVFGLQHPGSVPHLTKPCFQSLVITVGSAWNCRMFGGPEQLVWRCDPYQLPYIAMTLQAMFQRSGISTTPFFANWRDSPKGS